MASLKKLVKRTVKSIKKAIPKEAPGVAAVVGGTMFAMPTLAAAGAANLAGHFGPSPQAAPAQEMPQLSPGVNPFAYAPNLAATQSTPSASRTSQFDSQTLWIVIAAIVAVLVFLKKG